MLCNKFNYLDTYYYYYCNTIIIIKNLNNKNYIIFSNM